MAFEEVPRAMSLSTCHCLFSGVFRRFSPNVLTGKEDHGSPPRTRSADFSMASGVASSLISRMLRGFSENVVDASLNSI